MSISVIVPIYNMEACLEKCLESIRLQTYKELEIIMINDGSEDKSEEICLRYKEKDPRFFYYKQKNLGVSAARNKGLELASRQWIAFVDPDDYLDEDMIQRLYNEVDSNCDIVCCCCMVEIREKAYVNPFFCEDMSFEENKEELFMQLLDTHYQEKKHRYTGIGVPWGKLYRREFIIENNLKFDFELKRMQDNVLNFQAFGLAQKIKYINLPLYHYVVDHVERYMFTYDQEAVDYLSKVLQRQNKIIKEFGLEKNHIIQKLFIKEIMVVFILAVQKSYYNCPYMSNREKKFMSQSLLKQEPFYSLIKQEFPMLIRNIFNSLVYSGSLGIIIKLKLTRKRS